MICAYYFYYQRESDDMAHITKIDLKGSALLSVVLCCSMALLTYDDELILFY